MKDDRYLLEEISELAEVETRTIHHWMSKGLLEGAGRQGPGTRYPEEFLHRVIFIRKLRERSVPLELIAQTLELLPDDLIERVATDREELRVLPLSPARATFARQLAETREPSAGDGTDREAEQLIGQLRRLVLAARQRRQGANARWVTAQVDEDVLLMVRGLDEKQEEELETLARRLAELLSRRPSRAGK